MISLGINLDVYSSIECLRKCFSKRYSDLSDSLKNDILNFLIMAAFIINMYSFQDIFFINVCIFGRSF